MSDTVRNEAALLALMGDNTEGDISAQDVRDFIVSSLIDDRASHLADTDNPHNVSFADITGGTIAELNAKISDGNLLTGANLELVTDSTKTATAGGMYVAEHSSLAVDFTLPASPSVGDSFLIIGSSEGNGWTVSAGAAGHSIVISGSSSDSAASAGDDLVNSENNTDKIWLTYTESDVFEAHVYTDGALVDDTVFKQKLVGSGANGRNSSDRFGVDVDIDGDTCVISHYFHGYDADGDNFLTGAGAVEIYVRSGSTWSRQQKIVETGTNGRAANQFFGGSVAISGDTCVVGATSNSYDESGANYVNGAGAAYIYTRSGSTWSLEQKIIATGTNARTTSDQFGFSVAIDGDTCLISSLNEYDASGANYVAPGGAVFVYTRSDSTWSLEQKLVGEGTNGRNASDSFGNGVAISGDTCVVGAYRQDYDASGANYTSAAGAAYVYTRSGSTWSLEQKLVGEGTNGRISSDNFGRGVSIDGDTCAIGVYSQGYDAAGANLVSGAGAVCVYTRSGSVWSLQQKIIAEGTNSRNSNERFSQGGVAIEGDTLVVGSPRQSYDADGANLSTEAGAAFVYTRSGSVWSFEKKLVGEGTNGRVDYDSFAFSLGFSGGYSAVGAYLQDYDADGDTNISDAGAVYIFA